MTHWPARSQRLPGFADRAEAGLRLAAALGHLAAEDPIVVGLPRGGVPVAEEVARALGAELDVIVVRKLGVPFQAELAMGAIGEAGVVVLNDDVLRAARVREDELHAVEFRESAELAERVQRFRAGRAMTPLQGRTVIVVDDGIATGATARAAVQVARAHGARRVVLAVPVAPPEIVELLRHEADEVVAVETPEALWAVGAWYRDFAPVEDDEVVRILDRVRGRQRPAAPVEPSEIAIEVNGVVLRGTLATPRGAGGLVVFAHGSGSSRHSPRNRAVAGRLQRSGLATLLFDLLTPSEDTDRHKVFDIELLASRLLAVTGWARRQAETAALPIGYFGASTGAGAALWAAAEPGVDIFAVVSRGGRPDLAAARLAAVTAPTLLLVGGLDTMVIELNRQALAMMRCPVELRVIPGATHLFEEAGALDAVSDAAAGWFSTQLPAES